MNINDDSITMRTFWQNLEVVFPKTVKSKFQEIHTSFTKTSKKGTLDQFYYHLSDLAEHCEFGAGGDVMVSDIIINMSNSEIQDGLMKKMMTPERTLEYALRLEQTQKNTKTIRDNG